MVNTWIACNIVRPYIKNELPAWGGIYKKMVGGYESNADWAHASPTVIVDKRYGLYRLLDLRDWADRSFYFLKRWYDLEAQLLIDAIVKPNACIVDVGANYGHFSLAAAARTGTGGLVHAFEPNPNSYARLRTHVDMNRLGQIKTYNMGVSDAPGSLSLSVPLINSGEATFAGQPYAEATDVTCNVCTLDELGFQQKVDVLKIDVEGFEFNVLAGSRALIDSDRPLIITEVVRRHLMRAGAKPDDLKEFLEPLGYSAYRMGLYRAGVSHALTLEASDPTHSDGDYLWVPKSGSDKLAEFRSSGILVRGSA